MISTLASIMRSLVASQHAMYTCRLCTDRPVVQHPRQQNTVLGWKHPPPSSPILTSRALVGWEGAKGIGRVACRRRAALRHHLLRGLLRLGCLVGVNVLVDTTNSAQLFYRNSSTVGGVCITLACHGIIRPPGGPAACRKDLQKLALTHKAQLHDG
jgi:hypothetical protein